MRRVLLLLLAAALVYFVFWPAAGSPVVFQPVPNPGMAGPFAANERLRGAGHRTLGEGPEDIAKGPDGYFYTGLQDGRIVRFQWNGGPAETFVNTGGRPLGMHFDSEGTLIVADAFRGLLAIDLRRKITVLTDGINGQRFVFADDLDIAPDGVIWFSNASQRFDQHHYMLDFMETRPTGSLLTYDPRTGKTAVALSGLMFANGVALGPNGDYVLVNETIAARITRLWLRGPNAGRRETFLELPGYPDNLSYNGKGTFWVALPARRDRGLERIWAYPGLRKVLMRLPEAILKKAAGADYSWIIGVNLDGQIVANLQDPSGGSGGVTSVNEFDGNLYLGSITVSHASRYELPRPTQ